MEYKTLDSNNLEEVIDLFVETFNAPPWSEGWTSETTYKRLSQMLSYEYSFGLVCYEEDIACGLILGNEEQSYDGVMFEIKEFCIANNSRGKGMGSLLYKEFEKQLKQRGIDEIILLTLQHTMTEGFYRKHGFIDSKMMFMNKKI